MTPLPSIQILRALAALAVAYGHAGNDLMRLTGGIGAPLQGLSGAGVDLFFVISGFVMVLSSAPLFGTPGGAGVFLRRRLARIVPLYWATTTLFLAVMVLVPGAVRADGASLADIVRSFLFVPYLRADTGLIQPLYSLGWTLNYEMFFYVLFAAGLALTMARGAAAVAGVLVLIVGAGAVFVPEVAALRFWSDPIMLEFALGMGIGLAHVRGVVVSRAAAVAAGCAALAAFGWANQGGVLPIGWARFYGAGLPMAVLVAAVALAPAVPLLSLFKPLVALGDASYALYLIHPMVIRPLVLVWERAGWGGTALFIVAALAASATVALVIFRWLERPVTRALQGWARGEPGRR